jgi:hypothetical protein
MSHGPSLKRVYSLDIVLRLLESEPLALYNENIRHCEINVRMIGEW